MSMIRKNACEQQSFFPHRQLSRRRQLCLVVATIIVCVTFCCRNVRADFETIIDSPPTDLSDYDNIDSNTQVNLYPGGILPEATTIGPTWQPGDNIEINLLGGEIGSQERLSYQFRTSSRWVRTTNVTVNLVNGTVWGDVEGAAGSLITLSGAAVNGSLGMSDGSLAIVSGGEIKDGLSARDGSMIQMSGGTVGLNSWSYFYNSGASNGSVFLMSGGVINNEFVVSESYANISGGQVTEQLVVTTSGQLEITGGSHGRITTLDGGITTLIGGEFQLDGVSINGLNASSQSIDFPFGSVLTGCYPTERL